MNEHTATLADLRHDLDVLDDQIQDLLRRRAETVQRVAQIKRAAGGDDGFFLRTGREAQILRRLLARPLGPLPAAAMARINRELISALYEMQAPVRVAVLAPNKSVARWDLARDHFGSTTPMILCTTISAVMRAISAETAMIGVMPLPDEADREAWWPALANRAADMPRVVAKLPFVANSRASIADLGALVIARCPPEASGEDCSLIVVSLTGDAMSQARLGDLLGRAQLDGRVVAQTKAAGAGTRLLLELPGFIAEGDPRLAALKAAAPDLIADLLVLGAYAVPFSQSAS